MKKIKELPRIFPEYFKLFSLPEGAHEETIRVYRACKTGKCDRESFLPTYEEQGFSYKGTDDPKDPSVYSLSMFEKPNHIRWFVTMSADYAIPYKIAVGCTDPRYGLVQRTSDRKPKSKSHVDWWLYRDATPYEIFELIPDFDEYFENYKKERDGNNE